LSAATLGLEWTRKSLTSVQTSLQAETNAVMESLKSVSGESKKDDAGQLRHRCKLLTEQHKLLMSLFKHFKLQGKRFQHICKDDGNHWSPEVEVSEHAEDVCLSYHSRDAATLDTLNLQPSSSEHVNKKISDANINETFCAVPGSRCNIVGRTEAATEWPSLSHVSHSDDDDVMPACGADEVGNLWAGRQQSQRSRSDQQPQLLLPYNESDCSASLVTTSSVALLGRSVAYSHVDTASDCNRLSHDVLVQRPIAQFTSTTTTTVVTVCHGARPRSTSLTVSNSLSSSQPVCQLTEPAVKKLRLPPPSPSLLSTSSGSPPTSPLLLPVSRPVCATVTRHLAAAAPSYLATSQPSHYLQQASASRILPHYNVRTHTSSRTEPSSNVVVVSNIARGIGLLAPVSSTPCTSAVAQPAARELSASQKTTQRPYFSLRQLIVDDIIQPGHNVLSVCNSVIACNHFNNP